VTAIGGRPKPEMCFLPGRLRWTLAQGAQRHSTQWLWIEHPTLQLVGGHLRHCAISAQTKLCTLAI